MSCSQLGLDERELDTVSVARGDLRVRRLGRIEWVGADWPTPDNRGEVKRPTRPPWAADDGRVAWSADCRGQRVSPDRIIVRDRVYTLLIC